MSEQNKEEGNAPNNSTTEPIFTPNILESSPPQFTDEVNIQSPWKSPEGANNNEDISPPRNSQLSSASKKEKVEDRLLKYGQKVKVKIERTREQIQNEKETKENEEAMKSVHNMHINKNRPASSAKYVNYNKEVKYSQSKSRQRNIDSAPKSDRDHCKTNDSLTAKKIDSGKAKPEQIKPKLGEDKNISVEKRMLNWLEYKNGKIEEIRSSRQNVGMEQCTFHPFLLKNATLHPQIANDQIKNYDEYVEKMQELRKKKELNKSLESKKAGSGQIWNNKHTVPIGFNFMKQNNIKSIQKPVAVTEMPKNAKFHHFYPKSDLCLISMLKKTDKRQIEEIPIEVDTQVKNTMNDLHSQILNMDV